MTKVITHPGQAHLDDFIAVSLILAIDPNVNLVCRRSPTQEELDDPRIWVVDVGLRYEPEKRNLDHHQYDHNLPEGLSSASLVARLLELDTSLFPWWKGVDSMDCLGPFKTAASIGTTWDKLRTVASPINGFILREFAEPTDFDGKTFKLHDFTRGWWMWDLMQKFGESLISQARWLTTRLKELDQLAEVAFLEGWKWIIMLHASGPPGLEEWCIRNHPDAVGTITLDDRGPGLCLYRRDDHPAIDFTRCGSMSDAAVDFIHKNGFVIKLKTRDMMTAGEAVSLATATP